MDDEEAIIVEITETLGEATQRLRAIRNRLWATGLEDRVNYRDLAHRVRSALAMTEAAYLEARRRGPNKVSKEASRAVAVTTVYTLRRTFFSAANPTVSWWTVANSPFLSTLSLKRLYDYGQLGKRARKKMCFI
jgi:hypothetical protein